MKINVRLIIRIISIVIIIEALAMIPALIISSFYEESSAAAAFSLTIVIMLILGTASAIFSKPQSMFIRMREGLLIVSLSWITASLFSAFPYMLSESIPIFADAFFESASGFTTTGSTIILNVEALPRGILYWRSFTQWLGGMGILVFTVTLFHSLGIGTIHIAEAETPGTALDNLTPKITTLAKVQYSVYIAMTILEAILLMFGGMDLFDAIVHTFGSVGTGGFSSYNDSIGHFDSLYIEMVISTFCLLASINFNLYYILYIGHWREVIRNAELQAYLLIISCTTLLLTVILRHFDTVKSLNEAMRLAFFHTVTIITTSGYATTDFNLWPSAGIMVLFTLMFVGGCSSSIAGSVKIFRILVLFNLIRRGIYKRLHPAAVVPIKLNGRNVPSPTVSAIVSFFFLYLSLFLLGTLIISLENVDLFTAASSAATCLGNIGPGFGAIGPMSNFSLYSDASTIFLSVLMIAGRLELFTIFLLFMPGFWKASYL